MRVAEDITTYKWEGVGKAGLRNGLGPNSAGAPCWGQCAVSNTAGTKIQTPSIWESPEDLKHSSNLPVLVSNLCFCFSSERIRYRSSDSTRVEL